MSFGGGILVAGNLAFFSGTRLIRQFYMAFSPFFFYYTKIISHIKEKEQHKEIKRQLTTNKNKMTSIYSNAKIYKITGGGLTYYGSTVQKYLSKRMSHHKSSANKTSSKQIVNFPDCCIILVEVFPCNSKDELRARERYYIENNECVNKCIPGRTQQESRRNYCEQNKEKIAEYKKNWGLQNKEHVAEYNRYYRARQQNKLQSTNISAESPF